MEKNCISELFTKTKSSEVNKLHLKKSCSALCAKVLFFYTFNLLPPTKRGKYKENNSKRENMHTKWLLVCVLNCVIVARKFTVNLNSPF